MAFRRIALAAFVLPLALSACGEEAPTPREAALAKQLSETQAQLDRTKTELAKAQDIIHGTNTSVVEMEVGEEPVDEPNFDNDLSSGDESNELVPSDDQLG